MGEAFAKLILIVFIYGLFLFLINKFPRKWLNVKKKNLFSSNYVNDKHKKIDWIIKITFISLLFIGVFINVNRDSLNTHSSLETYILMTAFISVSEIVRIVMEKRYAENKNDYILSAIYLVAGLTFFLSVFFLVLKDMVI